MELQDREITRNRQKNVRIYETKILGDREEIKE